MNFRPGQRVTLGGTVSWRDGDGDASRVGVVLDGIDATYWFPQSALTPVVEPEPVWSPGDHVQVDGVDYMLHQRRDTRLLWVAPTDGWMKTDVFSQRWQEGRVVVVYRKEADK